MSDRKRQKKSHLWNHFSAIDEYYASCNACNSKLSYKTTTNNLRKHLDVKHNVSYTPRSKSAKKHTIRQRNLKQNAAVQLFNVLNSPARDEVQVSVNSLLENIEYSSQPEENLEGVTPIKDKNTKNNQVRTLQKLNSNTTNSKLISIFIKDYQPYSLIDGKGFREFVSYLKPNYQLPTINHLSNVAIPELYTKSLAESKELIKSGDIFCITLEMWTSESSDTYLSFTGHFLDETYRLNSILLDCSTITFDHNADNFAYHIKKIAIDWGIEEKIQFAVSANDSNIQVAILDSLGYEHFNCFAETLNSVISDSLQEADVSQLIEKVITSVTCIKEDLDLYNKLLALQAVVSSESTQVLTQFSETKCFRSLYSMLENYIKMKEIIKQILEENEDPISLNEDEWTMADQIYKVLKPFESVMSTLEKDKYCLASLVIPIVNGLNGVCNNLLKKSFLGSIKNVINFLKRSIKTNLGSVESSATLSVCTFLDPRFKHLAFSSKSLANQAKDTILNALVTSADKPISEENVEEELTVWHVIDQAVADNRGINTTEKNIDDDDVSVWSTFDNQVALSKPKLNVNAQALAEIQRYLDADMLPRSGDPLSWWLENKQVYPLLSTLARSQLCAVSTSIPSERCFSISSKTTDERRNKLCAKDTKMLMFLNAYNASH